MPWPQFPWKCCRNAFPFPLKFIAQNVKSELKYYRLDAMINSTEYQRHSAESTHVVSDCFHEDFRTCVKVVTIHLSPAQAEN